MSSSSAGAMGSSAATIVVLFNRDLRVHDHPALATACREAERVVPLFVVDDGLLDLQGAASNRAALLVDALADLRDSLRGLGGELIVRRGDPVRVASGLAGEVGASAIFASADVSSFARRREAALADACAATGLELRLFPGVTVVSPDALKTTSGSFYRIFTPYWRAWAATPWRALEAPPERVAVPPGLESLELPQADDLVAGQRSPALVDGGETVARSRLDAFLADALSGYETRRDLLAEHGTSGLSGPLHLGCLSPLELAVRAGAQPGGEAFVRQLCWRDYYHQLAYGFPRIASDDFRPRGDRWVDDQEALDAWREARTGYPIVDAGMRQLLVEGWMHNRARMLVASFLTKHLGLDWRHGMRHFARLLVDGDVANNAGNWQWVAGTGTDTRPNRILNPLRQAARFDPHGDYVRRYVPELADLSPAEIHQPWKLGQRQLSELGYPDRLVDHEEAARAFRQRVR